MFARFNKLKKKGKEMGKKMDTAMFGPVLKKHRLAQGRYMHQVGRELNISESCVCRYEKGLRQIPPDLLVKWARLLGAQEILTAACTACPVGVALRNDPINAA